MDLHPNPNCTSLNLNFKPFFVKKDTDYNPALDELGVDIKQVTADVVSRTSNTDLFLDAAFLPDADNDNRHAFTSVKWIDPLKETRRQFLASITAGYRLRLMANAGSGQGWVTALDVSLKLAEIFAENGWKDCLGPQKSDIEKLRNRSYLISTTQIASSEKDPSTLYLAQKCGLVLVVSLQADRLEVDMKVEHILNPEIGLISCLKVSENGLLLIGGTNGKVKAFSIGKKPCDLGYIWDDGDEVGVTEIAEVEADQTALKVIIAKGTFLIVVGLKIGGNGLREDTMEAFDVGPHAVVSVEQVKSLADREKAFLIGLKEGQWQVLKVMSEGNSVTPFEFKNDAIDVHNYSCHGLVQSRGGAAWVALQNGFIDNSNATARLLVFSQDNPQDLVDYLLTQGFVAGGERSPRSVQDYGATAARTARASETTVELFKCRLPA